jgi:hypothetical protein
VGLGTRESSRGRACWIHVVPPARLRPRRARDRLASVGGAIADGVKGVVSFVVNAFGALFGV